MKICKTNSLGGRKPTYNTDDSQIFLNMFT